MNDSTGRLSRKVSLRSGTLHLSLEAGADELDQLCGYASRRSRKRGFVFVSKVLGKHYPVRPADMARVHSRLAARLTNLPGPAVLIALAETATGLGHGIYESWLRRTGRTDVLFLHTTRYRLDRPLALDFQESHSHATEHLLYEPVDVEHRSLFHRAATVVLVDDEISTGGTLANLARAYRTINRHLSSVHFVCLTDWLGPARRAALAEQVGVPLTCHSVVRGSFVFKEDDGFDPGPIPDVTGRGHFKDAILSGNYGRLGVHGLLRLDPDTMIETAKVRPGERLLVLGSGEFAYAPYLLARRLEELGWDVHYQSTTRSPLLVDRDITSALEFADNYHDGIANYVYNVSDRRYDRVLIGYETRPLPAGHRLPEMLGAAPVFF